MIGYVVLGTNDLPRASAFYDALLAEMGVGRQMEFWRPWATGWGSKHAASDALRYDAARWQTRNSGKWRNGWNRCRIQRNG